MAAAWARRLRAAWCASTRARDEDEDARARELLLEKRGATRAHMRGPPNVMNQERSFGTSIGQKYASTPYGRSAVRRSFSRS